MVFLIRGYYFKFSVYAYVYFKNIYMSFTAEETNHQRIVELPIYAQVDKTAKRKPALSPAATRAMEKSSMKSMNRAIPCEKVMVCTRTKFINQAKRLEKV